MIKSTAILTVLTLGSLVFIQATFNGQEQISQKNGQNILVSQEEIEHASDFLGSFDAVISQSVTLEALLQKMADCVANLKKAKESCVNQEQMQYCQNLRQAIDELDVVYEECAAEINKIAAVTNHDNEAILNILIVKFLCNN